MERLNEHEGIYLTEHNYYTKEELIDLYRIQKQLLIEENIVASLKECENIWQKYSSDLCASWLFLPDDDEYIIEQIKSSDFFTSFEDYSK
jgi:hypothetical protein